MKYYFIAVILFFTGIFIGTDIYWRQNINHGGKADISTDFSVNDAPKDSVKGEIASMSGKILWQSRIASEPGELASLNQVQQGEKIITGGSGNIKVTFKNNGSISMFPDSELNIVQTLPQNFVFEQDKGSIEYQTDSDTFLSTRIYKLLTTLKKGTMNINIDDKGEFTTCSLINGESEVAYNDINFLSHTLTLTSGDKFIFDNFTREGFME